MSEMTAAEIAAALRGHASLIAALHRADRAGGGRPVAEDFIRSDARLMFAAADKLEALPTDDAAVEGWQPIETAPKDGSRVLAIWLYRPGDADAGSKSHGVVRWCGWWDSHGFTVPKPTHWRPLPEPPSRAAIAAMAGR